MPTLTDKPTGCGLGCCERQQLGAEPCLDCTDPVMIGDDTCLCDHCAVRQRGECEQWNEPGADVICASICSEYEEATP